MKVSVIVPAYKFFNYLEHALMSVLWQITNFEFEVLVRDDFSQDNSDIILARMAYNDKRLRYFEASENWGFYKNIKFLCEQSKGEYIAYLDGDDYFTDRYKLQKQVDFLDANPEYSCHSTGSYMIFEDRYIPENPALNLISSVEEITPEHFLTNNYVSFGRMFRNYRNLFSDYMKDVFYLDYAINFELSLRGKIKCEEWPGGVYRANGDSIFAKLSREKKEEISNDVKKIIKERLLMKNRKTLTIIDSFVSNEIVESKLINLISKLKEKSESDILLISNTPIKKDIISNVKYHIYDCNNRLFNEEYTNLGQLNLYHSLDAVQINDIDVELQRHGLSVMVNLFNSLKFAKELGYTHFQRLEVDDLISDKGFEFISYVPELCIKNDKKGLFYVNDVPRKDISFHYFFCEVDYFLDTIKNIKDEKDYRDYIYSKKSNYDFMNVEEYVYQNISDNDLQNLIIKRPGQMQNLDFEGTTWNTESSGSNKPMKYENCTSKIYLTNHKEYDFAIVTYNYSDSKKERMIICYYEDGQVGQITHRNYEKNSWSFDLIKGKLTHIEVYELENKPRFLYRENNQNIKSSLIFKD